MSREILKKENKIFSALLYILCYVFIFCSTALQDCFANQQYYSHTHTHKLKTKEINIEEDACFKPYGVSLGLGYGLRDIVPLRIGFQKDFGKRWISECTWKIGGYWEGSFYYLKTRRKNIAPSNRTLQAIAGAAVFRFQRETCLVDSVFPYFELGIGLAYLNKKEIAGREMGLHLEFEDRAGMGIRFGKEGQYDFSYRFLHFSNACLGPRNNGINLHCLVLGYWF